MDKELQKIIERIMKDEIYNTYETLYFFYPSNWNDIKISKFYPKQARTNYIETIF